MSQAELLQLVTEILQRLEIPYMLVGSHASSFYGEPRTTHDIDLVVQLRDGQEDALMASFDLDRYYLSKTALLERRMANLIDTETGDKVDFFFLQDDPQSQTAFARRRKSKVLNCEVFLASAEDTILAKMNWDKQIGGSERQRADIREIVRICGPDLDRQYLQEQAAGYGLAQALSAYFDQV